MAVIARHLIIHGRVQGVFFRDWTSKTAHDLGLAGWVRNRRDGTVEAVVEGDAEAIERFLSLTGEGPSAANVQRIEDDDAPVENIDGFSIRPTA